MKAAVDGTLMEKEGGGGEGRREWDDSRCLRLRGREIR